MTERVIRLDDMTVYPSAAGAAASIGANRSSVIRAIREGRACKGVHFAALPSKLDGFDVSSDVVRMWCAGEVLRRSGVDVAVGAAEWAQNQVDLMISENNLKEDKAMEKMMYWDELNNGDELRGELREMLIRFMIDCNEYDTDVYLYIDEDDRIGRLDEFVNVGGNSWLDDDHITIYTDKQHHESYYDIINDVDELAEALNMDKTSFKTDVMRWLDKIGEWYEDSDIEDIELVDAIRYVDQHDTLVTNFCNWRDEYIRDYYCDDLDDVIDEIIRKYDSYVRDANEEE